MGLKICPNMEFYTSRLQLDTREYLKSAKLFDLFEIEFEICQYQFFKFQIDDESLFLN